MRVITSCHLALFLLFLAMEPVIAADAGLNTSILPAPDAQGKWGYVDAVHGKTLIAPQFHEAGFFYDGLAIVTYAYPNKAYDVRLVDDVTGKTTAASAIPTAKGLIGRDGGEILLADKLERASTNMNRANKGIYIPHLFLLRGGENDESGVFHVDKGHIVPPGKYKHIRFTPEGAVYCDGVYYEPDGKRHDPPPGGEIAYVEPKTATFRVREAKKERNPLEGVMRWDGSLIVPVKYEDVKAMPEAGVWLASRGDASVMLLAATAILTGRAPDIKESEDVLTVDVYDASGKVLRSFRARYYPDDVSGTVYSYKSKGSDYRADARTGEVIPEKESVPPADPMTGFQPFKEGGKYGIKNAAGVVSAPPVYDAVENLGGGLFVATHNKAAYRDNWGVIDGNGKEIIPFTYSSIEPASYPDRATGLLVCERLENSPERHWLMGRDGHFITPEDKPYGSHFYFNAVGLAVVWRGGKYGVIDYTGKEVLPCEYQTVFDELELGFSDDKSRGKDQNAQENSGSGGDVAVKAPLTVKDSLFRVERGELWGLYNGTGKELIPIQYGFISDIKIPDIKSGWINVEGVGRQTAGAVNFRTGQTIAPKYDGVGVHPGFFLAYIRGNKGKDTYIMLNAKGEETGRYEDAEWFDEAQVLAVKQNGKYALLDDKTGKQISPFRYDYVSKAVGPFIWGGMKKKPALLDGKPFIYRPVGTPPSTFASLASSDDVALVDGKGREYRIH